MGEALLRDVAAVDHQLGPGDERCLVGGEEQHAISNFDRLTEAAEWSERNLVGTLIGIGRQQRASETRVLASVDRWAVDSGLMTAQEQAFP